VPNCLKIALIIGSARRYRRELLCGIADYARTHGSWTFYHQERGLSDRAPHWLKKWQGDGIIAQIENKDLINLIKEKSLPTIDLFGLHRIDRVPVLDNDYFAIAELAANHLLDRGFRHFAYCGLSGIHYSEKTGAHFIAFLHKAGYEVNVFKPPKLLKAAKASVVEARGLEQKALLAQWIKSLPRPVGLMACNDLRAQQVLNSCAEGKVAVPDDVAVIGADNDEVLCGLSDPPLTSIDPNARKIGYAAAQTLERMIRGESENVSDVTLIKPSRIVVRSSTDVLVGADRRIARAVRYIRDNACNGIDVDDVLSIVGVSRRTMERRFAESLGRSPNAEIRRVRLERVEQLLHETDYTLDRIAIQSGYGYAANMINAFKDKHKQTPGDFRKQHAIAIKPKIEKL
jgi:LacI family transcriptional regulator